MKEPETKMHSNPVGILAVDDVLRVVIVPPLTVDMPMAGLALLVVHVHVVPRLVLCMRNLAPTIRKVMLVIPGSRPVKPP
jgi:hypothetical protein